MSARYIFKFDGVTMTDPGNWDQQVSSLKRDDTSRGLLLTQDVTLEFSGDGFSYLYDKFLNEGFCSLTDIEIFENCKDDENYTTIFKGTIFTASCQFFIDTCTLSCKIEDNSFYAKINNNKSLEAYINVGRSKNDFPIDKCTPVTIQMFYPCDPAAVSTRKGYTAFSAMKYLVAFMTDGEVDFASPVLDVGGEFEGLCIASGKQLRDIAELTYINKFSYSKAFDNLWKKLNLGFYIDTTLSKPTLILDYYDNLFDNTQVFSLEDVPGIKVYADQNKLYSAVRLGTTTIKDISVEMDLCEDDSGLHEGAFPENISFLGCKDETFIVLGKCNIDKTLDLNTDWIVSSNVIQDAYINMTADPEDNQYDNNIFFIDCQRRDAVNYRAYKDNNIDDGATRFYNVRLFNQSVAERFLGGIPNTIAEYLGDNDASFLAESNSTQFSSVFPVEFPVEITDADNNYNTTTFEYNIEATGIYTLQAVIIIYSLDSPHHDVTTQVTGNFLRYDTLGVAGTNLLSTNSAPYQTIQSGQTKTMSFTKAIYAQTGDKIVFSITKNGTNPLYTHAGSTYACIKTQNGGGVYKTYDPNDYPVILYAFTAPLTMAQQKDLRKFPKSKIAFSYSGKTYYGWPNDIKMNDVTGMTDFILISRPRDNG